MNNTAKWILGIVGVTLALMLCIGTAFAAVYVSKIVKAEAASSDPVAAPAATPGSSKELLEPPPDLAALDEFVGEETEVEEPKEVEVQPAAENPATSSTPVPQGNDPWFTPLGDSVDTSNPIPYPPEIRERYPTPSEFYNLSLDEKTTIMTEIIRMVIYADDATLAANAIEPILVPVEGEEGYGWNWDGKGVAQADMYCPLWATCHINVVDGNRTLFFRGHGEGPNRVHAHTVRLERDIIGGGGVKFNTYMAIVYERSIGNILHLLGEAAAFSVLPNEYEELINTELGYRLMDITELTGSEGVISVGTVKKGFGAFMLPAGAPYTCFDGAACLFHTDTGWQWGMGPAEVLSNRTSTLFDLAQFSSECEAYVVATTSAGAIANGPSCTQ